MLKLRIYRLVRPARFCLADLQSHNGEGNASVAKQRIWPPDNSKIRHLEICSPIPTQAFEDTGMTRKWMVSTIGLGFLLLRDDAAEFAR
jgi:hypothetical protein